MSYRYAASFVLEAHLPFVREFNSEGDLTQAGKEGRFFEFVSQTLLPLLEVFGRLEKDSVPFRLALAVSPVLCQMLSDSHLIKKYLEYTDKQIEFSTQELNRTAGDDRLNRLAKITITKLLDRKIAFTERYEKDLIKAIDYYRRKEKIEILGGCATNAFLPFLSHHPESLQAQIETPLSVYRHHFGSTPQGFWLPDLGWTDTIEPYLRAYNFHYTIIDSHGLLFGKPLPEKGSFYPVKTPNGTFLLTRDFYAAKEIEKISADELFLDNDRDIGYELSPELVSPFLGMEGERHKTGYKYWNRSGGKNAVYDPAAAAEKAAGYALSFLNKTISRLEEASGCMAETPLCLYAGNADNFGRFWHEGAHFIETLFRLAAARNDFQFVCPAEYIFKQKLSSFQVVAPEFSSWGKNGYAETWLDTSNDWIYRHLFRAMERMTELAELFPDDTGLKERALNQAARELLLTQSSDWPALLSRQDSTEYARTKAENALRNFTTIYEALGSNHISVEWLTKLERRHNLFPNINYRVFRKKK